MQKFAYFVSMISIHLFSAVLELQLWLQFRGNLSWMSFLMLYDRKLQNWKCTCVDLFCVFNFPCTLTKNISEPFLIVLKANISRPNIKKLICIWLWFSLVFQQLCENHSFRESMLERFWETYSEAVPRVMNILLLLTIVIYLKIINSTYCLDVTPNSQN